MTDRTRHPLCALVLAAAVALAYRGSLNNGFTFDDHAIVEGNPALAQLDWAGLVSSSYWSATGANTGLYRPVTLLSLALNRLLLGPDPAGFHAVNLALHAMVAMGLCGLAARWLPWTASLMASLLFALHPALTEAVNSAVGRAELLSLGFSLVAVGLLCRPGSGRVGPGGLVLAALALVVAQWAKESGLAVVAALAATAAIGRRPAAEWAVPLVSAAAATATRWAVTGRLLQGQIGFMDNPLAFVDVAARLASGLGIAVRYVLLLTFPWPLSADYSYNQIQPWRPGQVDAVAATLFVASGALVSLRLLRRSPGGRLWWAVTWMALGLVSHLVAPLGTIFGERLAYLPAAGFCLGCGWALRSAGTGSRRQLAVAAVAGAWLAIAGLLVARRTAEWRDDRALFSAAVGTTGASARSHYGLGLACHRAGDLEEAVAAYDRALAIYPRYADAHYNRGAALIGLGRHREALAAYAGAAACRRGHEKALLAAATLAEYLGDEAAAILAYERLLAEIPGHAGARERLAGLRPGPAASGGPGAGSPAPEATPSSATVARDP